MSEHNQVALTTMDDSKDRPQAASPLKVMDLTFRDGHQSLFATRGRTEDMVPVAEMMDEVGFWALETWGGATFDTMHRFLNEDPWERIRTLKRHVKKTPFTMLLRAQSLVGYRHYADDVARAFVERAAENGIDIFRVFDALNDYRNFEPVVSVIKEGGKHFQGCLCYSITELRMGGEVYNTDYFINKAKELEGMEADSVCIKDTGGLLAPYDAYVLVKALKAAVSLPVHLHSHSTAGLSSMSHLKAIEAGVDIIDTCMSPYAYRASHPAIEPLVLALMGTNRDTGFDLKQLAMIDKILEKDILPKYMHMLDDIKASIVDVDTILNQIPGGMVANIVNQLREMDALDKFDEVLAELPRVRKDLGQIPLVTPISQIVGVQAVNNVLFDDESERYKMITGAVKDLCYGMYGKTAVPIDPEVQKKALKGYFQGEEPITGRPGEVLEPELEEAKEALKELAVDLDDVLTYTLYPDTGKRFLKWKYGKEEPPPEVKAKTLEEVKAEQELIAMAQKEGLPAKVVKEAPPKGEFVRTFNVFVDNEYFEVEVEEPGGPPVISYVPPSPAAAPPPATPPAPAAPVPPVPPPPEPKAVAPAPPEPKPAAPAPPEPKPAAPAPPEPKAVAPAPPPPAAPAPGDVAGTPLTAPMPGTIVRYEKQLGDLVSQGETVVVLEAMKMENNLASPVDGTVKAVNFNNGDTVTKDDVLCVIE